MIPILPYPLPALIFPFRVCTVRVCCLDGATKSVKQIAWCTWMDDTLVTTSVPTSMDCFNLLHLWWQLTCAKLVAYWKALISEVENRFEPLLIKTAVVLTSNILLKHCEVEVSQHVSCISKIKTQFLRQEKRMVICYFPKNMVCYSCLLFAMLSRECIQTTVLLLLAVLFQRICRTFCAYFFHVFAICLYYFKTMHTFLCKMFFLIEVHINTERRILHIFR